MLTSGGNNSVGLLPSGSAALSLFMSDKLSKTVSSILTFPEVSGT